MIFERRFWGVAACAATLLGLATTASANVTGTACLIQGAAAQTAPTSLAAFTAACATSLGQYTFTLNTSGVNNAFSLVIPPGTSGSAFVLSNAAGGAINTFTPATGLAGPAANASLVDMSGGPGNTAGGCGANNCYSTWWDITYTLAAAVPSTPVSITHDDGVVVVVGGATELNSSGPTSALNSPFNFSGAAGARVDIFYDECCGSPAQLNVSLPNPAGAIPEPSSIVLFGSAVLGVVFSLRRRQKVV